MDNSLDLVYANVKEAYSATALPTLGKSDHCLIQPTPTYKPIRRHSHQDCTAVVSGGSREPDGVPQDNRLGDVSGGLW